MPVAARKVSERGVFAAESQIARHWATRNCTRAIPAKPSMKIESICFFQRECAKLTRMAAIGRQYQWTGAFPKGQVAGIRGYEFIGS